MNKCECPIMPLTGALLIAIIALTVSLTMGILWASVCSMVLVMFVVIIIDFELRKKDRVKSRS